MSNGCWEVRGKTLGIVGYGHVGSQVRPQASPLLRLSLPACLDGSCRVFRNPVVCCPLVRQVSVLAESLGMQVRYYDHVPKLALGNAQSVDSLDALLACADFVSLHVPLTQVALLGFLLILLVLRSQGLISAPHSA